MKLKLNANLIMENIAVEQKNIWAEPILQKNVFKEFKIPLPKPQVQRGEPEVISFGK